MKKTFNIYDEIGSAYGYDSDEALAAGQKVYAYLAENKDHKAVLDFTGMNVVSPPFMIDLIDLCYDAGWKDRLSLIENSSEYITIMYEYAWRTIRLLKLPEIVPDDQPEKTIHLVVKVSDRVASAQHEYKTSTRRFYPSMSIPVTLAEKPTKWESSMI